MIIRVVVFVGEPGSGKSTIADGLIALRPELYKTLVSNTTRSKRLTDKPGDYRYVTREEIESWVRSGEVAWPVAESAGNLYAARREDIEAALADRAHVYFSILVPETAEIFYNTYPEKVLPIRIKTSIELLAERLRHRGTDPDDARRRLAELDRWKQSFDSGAVPYRIIENNGRASDAITAADQLIQKHLNA